MPVDWETAPENSGFFSVDRSNQDLTAKIKRSTDPISSYSLMMSG